MARNEQKKFIIFIVISILNWLFIFFLLNSATESTVSIVLSQRSRLAVAVTAQRIFGFAEYPFLLYVCSPRLRHSELKLIKSQKIIVHKMYSRAINSISDNENRIINNEMNK